MFYNELVFFKKNRVRRVYTGGALFSGFFSDDSVDGFYPEEWIASTVHALNKDSTDPKEGVSVIDGTDIYLDDAVEMYREKILGEKSELGILAKFIDSSIRLPVQAHPDKAFSEKYFNSSHGKEECWIILGVRPGAKIYYGFKNGVTQSDFVAAIEQSENKTDKMKDLLNSIDVIPGDVIYIPAKMVHAIGYGCLLLEIQEPTDFTIQPERYCGEYRLTDGEMYLGLDRETALECFDYAKTFEAPLILNHISDSETCLYQSAVDSKITESFSINTVNLYNGEFNLKIPAAVYVVTEGEGEITGENYERKIRRGDYFLLPACAVNKFKISGTLNFVESFSKGE